MPQPNSYAFTQRVRYAETDGMGVVWHGNYLLWFEVGRVETLRAIGYPYSRLEREGFGLPVTEVCLHYMRPARFDDLLRIEVSLADLKSRMFRIRYRITNDETGDEIVTGFTEHICWKSGVVTLLPQELRDRLRPFVSANA